MSITEEVLRYLGYKGEPDEQTKALISRASKAMLEIQPLSCHCVLKKSRCEHILVGNDIKKHLDGCERVIIFAATLGVNADRLIRSAEVSDMAYAVVLDAYASAFTEKWCDACEDELKRNVIGDIHTEYSLTERYSPGYGDYPIWLQGEYIKLLSAQKKIGLTCTENHILTPRKSVTAIMGITENPRNDKINKCENCNMKDKCIMRKDGRSCGR